MWGGQVAPAPAYDGAVDGAQGKQRREKRDGVLGKTVNRWKFQSLLCKLNFSQSFALKHEKFQ